VPLAGVCIILAACSGGGAADTAAIPVHSATPAQSATGTMTIRATRATPARKARRPAYVSPATTFATLWIDNDTTGFRTACPLPAGPCTIGWQSTYGPHTFVVELDDSPAFSGGGNVLADISAPEDLDGGNNNLPALTLNGVAAQVAFVSDTPAAANSPPCAVFGVSVNCIIAQYAVEDADGNFIQPPGNFDGGGACVTATDSNVAWITNTCNTNPSGLDQGVPAICAAGATGTFTFVAESEDAYAQQPGLAGPVSTAQLATYALTYPNQSAYAVSGWPAYNCSNGTISEAG
jgi:hypothetical protein